MSNTCDFDPCDKPAPFRVNDINLCDDHIDVFGWDADEAQKFTEWDIFLEKDKVKDGD